MLQIIGMQALGDCLREGRRAEGTFDNRMDLYGRDRAVKKRKAEGCTFCTMSRPG